MTADEEQRSRSTPGGGDVPPGMPAWVTYLLLGLLALVVIAVLAMLLVGGEHGPGRHGGSQSAPAATAELRVGL